MALVLLAGCGARGPALHRVAIHRFLYQPATLTVAVGDTVLWTNRDIVPHTATAAGSWDSGNIAPGDSALVTLTHAGAFAYACAYHPIMKAKLEVRGR